MRVFEDYSGDNYNKLFTEEQLDALYSSRVFFVEKTSSGLFKLKSVVKIKDVDVARSIFTDCVVLMSKTLSKEESDSILYRSAPISWRIKYDRSTVIARVKELSFVGGD